MERTDIFQLKNGHRIKNEETEFNNFASRLYPSDASVVNDPLFYLIPSSLALLQLIAFQIITRMLSIYFCCNQLQRFIPHFIVSFVHEDAV